MKIAVCPGSFDPVTNGHVDIIGRAARLFDRVIVVVLSNPVKNTLFSAEERVTLVKKALKDIDNIEVDSYIGLTADYARQKNACAVVRGLRALSDFEYEFQMALTNKQLCPAFETLFLTTSAENLYLSSSMVKQIAQFGGDISEFVPPQIMDDILRKMKNGM